MYNLSASSPGWNRVCNHVQVVKAFVAAAPVMQNRDAQRTERNIRFDNDRGGTKEVEEGGMKSGP